MAAMTPAQEEFQSMIDKASRGPVLDRHPEDARQPQERDEEDDERRYQRWKVEEELKHPSGSLSSGGQRLNLPPPDFDNGRTTGVKGVIADARSYEQARWAQPRGPVGNKESRINSNTSLSQNRIRDEEQGGSDLDEEEEFLGRWREERTRELAREGNDIRNRRTSPSVRRYGRFDEVDALGYLDAIEKVGKETKVVVFVYDSECAVSQVIEEALVPLVPLHPAIHFVKVHYDDIEFDNAAVPAILAYRDQGTLFANLTYIIGEIPEDTLFDTKALKDIFRKHDVL